MPPPPTGMLRPNQKPTGKPTKTRYFKGKAPDAPLSDSDSDSGAEEQISSIKKRHEAPKVDKNFVAGGAGRVYTPGAGSGAGTGMKVELRDVKVEGGRVLLGGKDGGVKQEESEEEETDEESEEEVKPKGIKPPGGEESSEYETDSEESESEPEPPKPVFRPVFKPKTTRGMTQEKAAAEAEEAARREEEAREEKKLASKELAGETIRRELAEREAADIEHTVDDTDGIDPTTEFDAWRARELARLLRDKQAQAARDEEKEEIERRRAMPEEQRMREDLEHANKTREKEKGEMGFLQKYYHKGAFHQDDELLNRDYTGATQSSVDMSMLPKVMQVRDFGKASRTKYTHLADQDTSQGGWGNAARPAGPGGIGTTQTGCWNCGGPHQRKDCPNNNINDMAVLGGATAGLGTSANTAQLGSGSRSWGGGGGGGGGYNDWDRDQDRERPRYRDGGSDRDRDRSDRGNRYRDEGRERRYDDDRKASERSRGDDHGRDRHRDRDRNDERERASYGREKDNGRHEPRERERRRERSGSPSRKRDKGKYDRHREDRRSDDRDRERERERTGDSERDRHRERDSDRSRTR